MSVRQLLVREENPRLSIESVTLIHRQDVVAHAIGSVFVDPFLRLVSG